MDFIKNKLENIIKKVGSCNPYTIAKYLNIQILYHELPKTIKGYSSVNKRMKTIVLNYTLDKHEEVAVLCHEIGHAVLHPDTNTTFFDNVASVNFKSKIEYEANCFMFYLLKENLDFSIHSEYDYLESIGLPASMRYYINKCW